MSMYAELLVAALRDDRWSEGEPTTGVLLAKLLRYRSRLAEGTPASGDYPTPAAVADQLAYDATLIDLARRLGVECDVHGFAQPQHERARLERELSSRGVDLKELDDRDDPEPEEW